MNTQQKETLPFATKIPKRGRVKRARPPPKWGGALEKGQAQFSFSGFFKKRGVPKMLINF
jgi:hypothetical protein